MKLQGSRTTQKISLTFLESIWRGLRGYWKSKSTKRDDSDVLVIKSKHRTFLHMNDMYIIALHQQ